ncbi:hypothetical protein AB0L06_39625 [Spirillospora sp. NPDC052269]
MRAELVTSGAICPTVLLDSHGYPVAYCADHATRHGELRLLDPSGLTVLASMRLPPSDRPDDSPMYLDAQDRAVLGDGADHILRVTHTQSPSGFWTFRTTDDWDVSRAVATPDHIESVAPGFDGRVWFSSANGTVGTLTSGVVHVLALPKGERVANAISSARVGVAVPSDHALYVMRAKPDGTPVVTARLPYDRGPGRQPGRLSWGTGTPPSFFGHQDDVSGRGGGRYLAIADNAVPREHLLVYRLDRRSGHARQVCRVPLFAAGRSAAEDAPITVGRSVIISNTYGYDYTSGDPPAALPGGLTRVDVRHHGKGCKVAWTNPVPSAAVPTLSARDGHVYTVQRTMDGLTSSFALTAVDASTGKTVRITPLGSGVAYETFQLAGASNPSGVLYQPTVSGILRISPRRKAERRPLANATLDRIAQGPGRAG